MAFDQNKYANGEQSGTEVVSHNYPRPTFSSPVHVSLPMLNMAFGQKKYANGVKHHSPGSAGTSPASTCATLGYRHQHIRDERELFHPNKLSRVATGS